jgi:release factor glutamine methyltransferase
MDLVRRRSAREPLQYILGRWEFHGRQFVITPAVMVPRPETELLVDVCLDAMEPGRRAWAADIGTGSGIIAVSLAAARPELRVIATDSSEKALETAALNAARHRVSGRVVMAKGHLAQPVRAYPPPGREGVELVVSNPPYVPTGDLESLQPEVRKYEPPVALNGGPDGLDVIRRLIPQATEVLLPGGLLALEIGQGQARAVEKLIQQADAYQPETVATVRDHAGIERVISARKRTK